MNNKEKLKKKTIVCIRLTQKSPPPVETIKKRKLNEFRSTYPISWSNQRPESHKNSIAKKYRCLTDWCTPQDDCNWTFRIKVAVLQVTHAFNPQYVSSGFLVAPIKDAFLRTTHKETVSCIYDSGVIVGLQGSELMGIIKILTKALFYRTQVQLIPNMCQAAF